MSISAEKLFEFAEFDLGLDVAQLTGSSPLFSSGLIDSFALVSLMTFIESEAGIRIIPSEVTLDNLDSFDRILTFTARKLETA